MAVARCPATALLLGAGLLALTAIAALLRAPGQQGARERTEASAVRAEFLSHGASPAPAAAERAASRPGCGARAPAGGNVTVAEALTRCGRLVVLRNHRTFDGVADALHAALGEAGVPRVGVADAVDPAGNASATYLIFTAHLGGALPRSYVAYNLEQLTARDWPEDLFERLRGAELVLDYSLANIAVLRRRGVARVVHLPLGYAPALDNPAPPARERDVDVAFVGWLSSPRRQARLVSVAASARPALRVVFTESHFGAELHALLRRTRLALNLHFHDGPSILEVHRILPTLASRVLVLSEPSDDPWWDARLAEIGAVNFTPRGAADIGAPVLAMLRQYGDGAAEAERRFQRLRECCAYARFVRAALASTIPAG
ncbi:hypothetical protein HT031_001041 [Scenedesmus sp. PABB004]|nr:hypothetical protein HT031_001041 [Scenedesmus sp. PABB004]